MVQLGSAIRFASLALALAAAAPVAVADQPDLDAVRMVAPDGAVVTMRSVLAAQPLVVNLWATWCLPCREELPSLAALDHWLESRGGRVLLIAAGPAEPGIVNEFLHQRLGLAMFESFVDRAGLVTAAFQITSFPATIIFARDGTILETVDGARNWDTPEMRAHIAQWLAAEP